eukprot:COSAG02_NODE_26959_length_620_cov_0.921305_1_plen_48_part_10
MMNVYKTGEDCIGYHRDREDGWQPGTFSSVRRQQALLPVFWLGCGHQW